MARMSPPRPAGLPHTLDEWRPRATEATLWASLAANVPSLLAGLQRDTSLELRLYYLGSFVLLAALALARRSGHRARAALYLANGYTLAAVGLARIGLAGSARVLLFVFPLIGLLLIGRRAGAACLAISATLYGAFTALAFLDLLPPPPPQTGGAAWLWHGIVSVMFVGPVAVLLDRALAFLEGAVIRARVATERLAAAAEEQRRLEGEVIEATEREQRRLGHELHDGLCQQLTAGLLSARLLERGLAGRALPEAQQATALAEVVEAALAEARALSRGLTPGPLPPGGLGAALRDLARQIRETVEVDCEVVGASAPSVGGPAATQLFRIAQEATQNAVKHADAERITIDLSESPAEVRLEVRDDGRGLAPQAAPGLGMNSMRARALALGGALEVGAAPGGGTAVLCRVPRSPPRPP